MKSLKRLGVSVTLLCVLSLTTLAGSTNSPPCTPDPGETNSPPCALSQGIQGDTETVNETAAQASTAEPMDIVTEVAVDLFQSALLLF